MAKKLITDYTFVPAAKTITFNQFKQGIDLRRLLLITNTDTGEIVYNFADPLLGATVASNTVTLEHDVTALPANANLQIWYWLGRMEKVTPELNFEDLVETERQTFREDFEGVALDLTAWDVLQQGGGQTINVTASTLNIGAGVVANEVTRIRSKRTFTLPFRTQFTLMISQRIINQTFYVEVVNAAGTTYAQWLFDGITAATQKIGQAHQGVSNPASPSGGLGTTNNTGVQAVYELDLRADGVDYIERGADNGNNGTVRGNRSRTIPEPGEEYYIQIRAVNGAVAPASNTTMAVDIILVQDVSKFVAEISAGRASTSTSRALGAFIVNTPNMTLSAGTQRVGFVQAMGIWYDDSTTVLAAAATFTGTARDLTLTPTGTAMANQSAAMQEYRASAISDVAGTLYLEISRDGSTNWRRIKAAALAQVGGTGLFYAEIIHRPSHRYIRPVFINGATLQTQFTLSSVSIGN
jgi:hypothetical protein